MNIRDVETYRNKLEKNALSDTFDTNLDRGIKEGILYASGSKVPKIIKRI